MSMFGWGASDVVSLIKAATEVVILVRNAPSEFRVFEADLNFANIILGQLQRHFDLLKSVIGSGSDTLPQDAVVIGNTIDGIRSSLSALKSELTDNGTVDSGIQNAWANFQFSRHLERLRERLQFHMESLNLVLQILQNEALLRAGRLSEATQKIQKAQEVQMREDDKEHDASDNTSEDAFNKSLHDFSLRYLPEGKIGESESPDAKTIISSVSRASLIDQWRRKVAHAQRAKTIPTIPEETVQINNIAPDGGTMPIAPFLNHPSGYKPNVVPGDELGAEALEQHDRRHCCRDTFESTKRCVLYPFSSRDRLAGLNILCSGALWIVVVTLSVYGTVIWGPVVVNPCFVVLLSCCAELAFIVLIPFAGNVAIPDRFVNDGFWFAWMVISIGLTFLASLGQSVYLFVCLNWASFHLCENRDSASMVVGCGTNWGVFLGLGVSRLIQSVVLVINVITLLKPERMRP